MTIEEWAEDFKSYVNELQMPRDDYKGIMEYIDDAVAIVRSQPTVDAVPVVRCRECKYDPRNNSSPEELPYWFPCKNGMRDQDWFCAYGKKDGCQMKRPKETFWDSLSEADLMEPMRHFKD